MLVQWDGGGVVGWVVERCERVAVVGGGEERPLLVRAQLQGLPGCQESKSVAVGPIEEGVAAMLPYVDPGGDPCRSKRTREARGGDEVPGGWSKSQACAEEFNQAQGSGTCMFVFHLNLECIHSVSLLFFTQGVEVGFLKGKIFVTEAKSKGCGMRGILNQDLTYIDHRQPLPPP